MGRGSADACMALLSTQGTVYSMPSLFFLKRFKLYVSFCHTIASSDTRGNATMLCAQGDEDGGGMWDGGGGKAGKGGGKGVKKGKK